MLGAPRAGKGRKAPLLEPPEGINPASTLGSDFWPWKCEGVNSGSKLPGLWYCVLAAPLHSAVWGAVKRVPAWQHLYHRGTDRQKAFTLENDFGSVQGSYCRFGKSASQGPRKEGAENLPVIALQETHEHTSIVREGGKVCSPGGGTKITFPHPRPLPCPGPGLREAQQCECPGPHGPWTNSSGSRASELHRCQAPSTRGDALSGPQWG